MKKHLKVVSVIFLMVLFLIVGLKILGEKAAIKVPYTVNYSILPVTPDGGPILPAPGIQTK